MKDFRYAVLVMLVASCDSPSGAALGLMVFALFVNTPVTWGGQVNTTVNGTTITKTGGQPDEGGDRGWCRALLQERRAPVHELASAGVSALRDHVDDRRRLDDRAGADERGRRWSDGGTRAVRLAHRRRQRCGDRSVHQRHRGECNVFRRGPPDVVVGQRRQWRQLL